jgi:hypothetical protein
MLPPGSFPTVSGVPLYGMHKAAFAPDTLPIGSELVAVKTSAINHGGQVSPDSRKKPQSFKVLELVRTGHRMETQQAQDGRSASGARSFH